MSAAVLALIGAGASAPEILDQFLDEKEGNHTTAYRDGAGIWTICRGAILVDGKPVVPGMKLSKEKCDRVNAIERDKALAWVEKNIKVPLTEPQKAGIASFCPYNIGPGKCFPSTFYKRINAGDRKGACEAIRWWIGRKRLRINATCSGTVREATGTSGVDNATGPRLADTAERDYFILRERLMTMQKQLEGAQDYIRTQCLN
ncbi:lysozyme [Escherichia coli]|nr:lysozyme [Escherichia coli]